MIRTIATATAVLLGLLSPVPASSDPMTAFLVTAPPAPSRAAAPAAQVLAEMAADDIDGARRPSYEGRSAFRPVPDPADDPFRQDWTGEAGDCWYAKPGVPDHWGKCL